MRLKIGHKIFGIASVVLFLMIVVAGYSIHLTAQISAELDRVANKHLPLVDDVIELDVHILEQDVLLQRMLALAEDHTQHESARDTLVLPARLKKNSHWRLQCLTSKSEYSRRRSLKSKML